MDHEQFAKIMDESAAKVIARDNEKRGLRTGLNDGPELPCGKSRVDNVLTKHPASDVGNREMTLDEVMCKLHPSHRARVELDKLRLLERSTLGVNVGNELTIEQRPLTPQQVGFHLAEPGRVSRRAERVQVASEQHAALLRNIHRARRDDPLQDNERLVADALFYADALLARIDGAQKEMRCALCTRTKDQVRKMIGSEYGGYICGRCVMDSVKVLEAEHHGVTRWTWSRT